MTTSGTLLGCTAVPTTSAGPWGIVAGADGNIWFAEDHGNKVGRVTPAESITEYPIPTASSLTFGITSGADGRLWFAESGKNNIGAITDDHKVTVSLSPSSGPPGTSVTVTGIGFGSFEHVKLTFVDSVAGTSSLGTATADAAGHFSTVVTIPAGATTGPQKVRGKGKTSALVGQRAFTVQ